MELKSIKSYKSPKYPDKTTFKHMPGDTNRLPKRWKNKLVSTVILPVLLLPVLSSCSEVRTGGKPMAEPMLTEDEAKKIIIEILSDEGLKVSDKVPNIKGIHVPVVHYEEDKLISSDIELDINPDIYISSKNISIEYISNDDQKNLLSSNFLSENLVKLSTDATTLAIINSAYSEEELKQQVIDFLAWLKAHGTI